LSAAIFALNDARALASRLALSLKAMSSDGGGPSRFALAWAVACALQSADASQFADALGGVALPLQLPEQSPLQEPEHDGASPVQSASASTLQLPVHVPEQLADAASSHVPVHMPTH
jgi:hypothetical protein